MALVHVQKVWFLTPYDPNASRHQGQCTYFLSFSFICVNNCLITETLIGLCDDYWGNLGLMIFDYILPYMSFSRSKGLNYDLRTSVYQHHFQGVRARSRAKFTLSQACQDV